MADNEIGLNDNDATADRVTFDYIKSHLFRTISPDGMLGSLTPQDRIQFAFFSERQAIPQRVIHKLDANGQPGEVDEMIGRDSIVREVEAVISLDEETATLLQTALTRLLRQIEDERENGNKK